MPLRPNQQAVAERSEGGTCAARVDAPGATKEESPESGAGCVRGRGVGHGPGVIVGPGSGSPRLARPRRLQLSSNLPQTVGSQLPHQPPPCRRKLVHERPTIPATRDAPARTEPFQAPDPCDSSQGQVFSTDEAHQREQGVGGPWRGPSRDAFVVEDHDSRRVTLQGQRQRTRDGLMARAAQAGAPRSFRLPAAPRGGLPKDSQLAQPWMDSP